MLMNLEGGAGPAAGTATAQAPAAPAPATAEKSEGAPAPAKSPAAPVAEAKAEVVPKPGEAPVAPDKPARSDKEIFEGAKAKLSKDRNYRMDQEEIAATKRVQRGQGRPANPEAAAVPPDGVLKEGEAAKPALDVPAPVKAVMDKVGAKSIDELPAKFEQLTREIGRLGGQTGPLNERLSQATSTVETQHAIIRDVVMGVPRAMEWVRRNAEKLGIDVSKLPAAAGNPPPAAASAPGSAGSNLFSEDLFLDPSHAGKFNQAFSALEARNQKLESDMAAMKEEFGGKFQKHEKATQFYETELQKNERINSQNSVVSAVQALIDDAGNAGVYDKRHGPVAKHMEAYWNSAADAPIPAPIQTIMEIIDIAHKKELDSLDDAYAIWAKKNRGKLNTAAARTAQAHDEHAPAVGMSDRQEGNGGRVPIGMKAQDILDMLDRKRPIDPSLKGKNGRFLWDKVPADVRAEVEARRGRK